MGLICFLESASQGDSNNSWALIAELRPSYFSNWAAPPPLDVLYNCILKDGSCHHLLLHNIHVTA